MCILLIKQPIGEGVSEPIIVNYITEYGEERTNYQFTFFF